MQSKDHLSAADSVAPFGSGIPTLPDVAEPFLRDPAVLKVAVGDDFEFDDDAPMKWAWGAHGYATGMVPFYSAEQMKAAMQAAWDASRAQALEDAAKLADRLADETPLVEDVATAIRAAIQSRGNQHG